MSLTLRRLTALEEGKLAAEHAELTTQIGHYASLMSSDEEVYRAIQQETRELRDKHARPRRSELVLGESAEVADEDLLANDRYAPIGVIWAVISVDVSCFSLNNISPFHFLYFFSCVLRSGRW